MGDRWESGRECTRQKAEEGVEEGREEVKTAGEGSTFGIAIMSDDFV